jgi:phosphatidylglycerol:prolipoprotein diacylglycerol transferase
MIPILYESQYLSVQTLWVFVVIALLSSSYLAMKRLKRSRVNFNLFIKHSSSYLISALVFSRIIYFTFHADAYFPAFDLRTLFNFVSIWDQGFSLVGAVLGIITALTYHIWKSKEELWKWYDALIVPLYVGMMIGNFGAFLGGYGYGIPTNLPWGIQYESFNVKYTVPIHPTQIYSILILGFLLWTKFKLKEKTNFFKEDGNTTLYLTSTGSFAYFLLEFIRGDDMLTILDIRISIFGFALLFLFSSGLLYRRYQKFKTLST